MKFISLIDPYNQNVITINADSFIFRLEIDGIPREIRIKPFMGCVLYELFQKHPHPLSYDAIIGILKKHNFAISDFTRMHRKLSEIRQCIEKVHPSLEKLVLNTRGIGYSLPLRLKNLHQISHLKNNIKFSNSEITKTIEILEVLIHDVIDITAQNKVKKHPQGYILNCDSVRHILVEKVSIFHECEKSLLKEIRAHEADFISLRVNYLLAKLKTYVGLARISEYPISETQWLDWFKQEVWLLFEELKKLIRFSETV